MSSVHHTPADDRKSSALPENIRAPLKGIEPLTGGSAPAETPKNAKGGGKVASGRRGSRRWAAVLVDVILLLVLAGLITGAWFGFTVLRELYAPTWETRTVVYTVELQGVSPGDVQYSSDGRFVYIGAPVWSSVHTDADFLGTVTDVTSTRVTDEAGASTLTLVMTVEADAFYREGKGYRMGETMLLAGLTGEFRFKGMTAQGTVISLKEKQEPVTHDPHHETEPMPEDTGSDARG
jgi:hypothetical protein